MKIKFLTLSAIAALTLMSCDKDNGGENTVTEQVTSADEQAVLTDLTNSVIIPTYFNLRTKSEALSLALTAYTTAPSTLTLAAAKRAWVETREPWEQSEGFLYGPVKTPEDRDGAMDTWPVKIEDMNAIIASGTPITADVIASNDEARGFHLIEFLLWGEDGKAQPQNFSARQIEYLKAAATDLKNNTTALHTGWVNGYDKNFLNAAASDEFKSTKSAVNQIVTGLWIIANEVGTGKIADSFGEDGTPDYEKEESRFSNNSKKDFADNMRSIENIYFGKYGNKDVKGINELVKKIDANLNTKLENQILQAIKDIEAIPGTYTEAIAKTNTTGRAAVKKAQDTVNALRDIIENELGKYYDITKPKE